MRLIPTMCLLVSVIAQPVLAAECSVSVGDYKLEQGDIKTSSVVSSTKAEGVLSSEAGKKLAEMSEASTDPVLVQVGSQRYNLVVKDILGESGPMFFKDKILSIPGQNNSEALVLQQQLRMCI